MLKLLMEYLKDRWMWLKSFVQPGLVKTGQSFTTDENTTIKGDSNKLLELDQKVWKEKEETFTANPDVCFKVVGAVCTAGTYKYRVLCPANNQVFDIDTDLYELLFGNLREDKKDV